MTEIETIEYAKSFIDKLANGINPIDDSPIPDGDVINNVRLSRCLFFVSDILRKVIDNGGIPAKKPEAKAKKKREMVVTDEMRLNLKPYAEDVNGSTITRLINNQIPEGEPRLKMTTLNKWLKQLGLIEKVEIRGRKCKCPTPMGEEIGMYCKVSESSYGSYCITMFTPEAQQFVLDNIDDLVAFQYPSASERSFKPWTDEENQIMISAFNEGKSITEIASLLQRSYGAVRKRLKKLELLP
ncbi:MAG: hypothetical protein IKA74_05150 [Clostridia bacterium]|nr:hypothetical protein [Clostridia bacterium]